jgi:hypothetical protein
MNPFQIPHVLGRSDIGREQIGLHRSFAGLTALPKRRALGINSHRGSRGRLVDVVEISHSEHSQSPQTGKSVHALTPGIERGKSSFQIHQGLHVSSV